MNNKIRFDEIMDPDMLSKLYKAFEQYINTRKVGDSFPEVVKDCVYINEYKLNTEKILTNMDITLTEDKVIQFLVAHAYSVTPVLMTKRGHVFNANENLAIAGYSFFMSEIGCKDYPHKSPDDQTDEFINNNISDDFISTSATWKIESLIKEYDDEMHTK